MLALRNIQHVHHVARETQSVTELFDYDGDGKTDLAIWQGSEGNWYILESSTGSLRIKSWGLSSDNPLQLNYVVQ